MPFADSSHTTNSMKIYTRTGDSGSTGLFGGPRVAKDHARIEAYGTVDELNAAIGVGRSAGIPAPIDAQLETIQSELFSLGAELATPDPEKHQLRVLGTTQISRLEAWIDAHEATLPELKNFILPAGTPGASAIQLARAICRRAERRLVTLAATLDASDPVLSDHLLVYLNRLSDLLFVLARVLNHHSGTAETIWRSGSE